MLEVRSANAKDADLIFQQNQEVVLNCAVSVGGFKCLDFLESQKKFLQK